MSATPIPARLAALGRSPWSYVLSSILLLTPCYWQPRIEAGDLSSHIYNAWLAQLIEAGHTEGLVLVRQTTNILFDLMLSGLFKLFGPEAAQRIAVSLAVLTFVWGAFAFISVVAGRRAWHLMPCIAMLAYGWVFHMGFFNFYLSMGLCFWFLAAAWDCRPGKILKALPILAVAYLAHALPVVWTVGLVAFLWTARSVAPRKRAFVTAAFVLGMILVHEAISHTLVMRWSPQQITKSLGVDQVWVFDGKYYLVLIGLLLVWSFLFLELLHRSSAREVVFGLPFQMCAISAMTVVVLPTAILIPGFHHALVYIAERMSLGVGICVCGLLGAVPGRVFVRYTLLIVAVIFFSFLYQDEKALNSFEDRMQDVVTQLSPGQRVVSGIDDPDLHVWAVGHIVDRVCLGHCYSYANYEPSTGQFRVRVLGPNPYVISQYKDSFAIQTGEYVVKNRDLPLYEISLTGKGRVVIDRLEAGAACKITSWKILKDPLPNG